jgi:hypothetical protein
MLIVYIHNDGTGTDKVGNYDYTVQINHQVLHQGRVEGHLRGYGAAALIEDVALDIQLDQKGEIYNGN